MKQIPAANGQTLFVDDEDYERINSLSPWYYDKNIGYFSANNGRKLVHYHLFPGLDGRAHMLLHKDGNRRNNQKSNLEVLTRKEFYRRYPKGIRDSVSAPISWSSSAIDCYDLDCDCSRCPVAKIMETECHMSKVVRAVLTQLGPPKRLREVLLEEGV